MLNEIRLNEMNPIYVIHTIYDLSDFNFLSCLILEFDGIIENCKRDIVFSEFETRL